jgi:hypothetical protein
VFVRICSSGGSYIPGSIHASVEGPTRAMLWVYIHCILVPAKIKLFRHRWTIPLLGSVFRSWRLASRAFANVDPRRRIRRQAIRVYLRWHDEWTNELADYWFSDYMLEYFFEHWYLEMAAARAVHSYRRRYVVRP